MKIFIPAIFFLLLAFSGQSKSKDQTQNAGLMGNRFLTLNTVIRVNQIEVSRDKNVGRDERDRYTPELVTGPKVL